MGDPYVQYCVPTILVTRGEVRELWQERSRAYRDVMQRLGEPLPGMQGPDNGVRAWLRVHERCPDGSLRASVRVTVPGRSPGYVRRLRVTQHPDLERESKVHLRLTPD